jgi:hypothetical protein
MTNLRILGIEVDSTTVTTTKEIAYKIEKGLLSMIYTTAEKLVSDVDFYNNLSDWY